MPVNVLLVEGHLDAEILGAIVRTSSDAPEVKPGGSKGGLRPETRTARNKGIPQSYLRDRDFDYEFPPQSGGEAPEPDGTLVDGVVLGWRWCLHEMENYLLIPALVTVATGWDEIAYKQALIEAARHIRSYQAARWAVGTTRRELARCRSLRTYPDESKGEFFLPGDLSEKSQQTWAEEHLASQFNQYKRCLKRRTTKPLIGKISPHFGPNFPASAEEALMMCSGKNLMAALGPWLTSRKVQSPELFRRLMRDWIIDHPETALSHVPEWEGLLKLIASP